MQVDPEGRNLEQTPPLNSKVDELRQRVEVFENTYGRGAALGHGIAGMLLKMLDEEEPGDEDSVREPGESGKPAPGWMATAKAQKGQHPLDDIYAHLPQDLKGIESLAGELGLRVVTDVEKTGEVLGFFKANFANIELEVRDADTFVRSVQSLQREAEDAPEGENAKAAESLDFLFQSITNRLLRYSNGNDLLNSADARALVELMPDIASSQPRAAEYASFISGIREELPDEQQALACDLFLEYQNRIRNKIGIISTGDAIEDYIKNADDLLQDWIARGIALLSSYTFIAFMEGAKTFMHESLREYISKHEEWRKEEGYDTGSFHDGIALAKKLLEASQSGIN